MAFASSQPLALRHVSAVTLTTARPALAARRAHTARRSRAWRMAQKNAPVVCTDPSLPTLLSSANQFRTLLRLIAVSRLSPHAIRGTVFAPTDAAFRKLSPELLRTCLSDAAFARQLVLRHVVLADVRVASLTANAFLPAAFDGALPYTSFGGKQIKIDGAALTSLRDCVFDNGVLHAISSVLQPPSQKWPSFDQTYAPPPPPPRARARAVSEFSAARARGAALSATLGARKAMGLMAQQPFWKYAPPYCAAKQEEFEPISAAVPELSSVDYQLMPPGSVFVSPDSVNASELNPVSGLSKYIGQTKRIDGKDALSDYSRLD